MSGHSKWANIKHRKGKQDALKAKITTKIGREIVIAVKNGGTDPSMNMKLKLALQKAKENNIPKDNINRALQKGSSSGDGSDVETILYEGYGPGGVAVLVEAMTDNRNRTVADVRHYFSKLGGNLGESGCVSWMFKNKGLFILEHSDKVNEDELMLAVLEAGAEEFDIEDEEIEIICAPESFEALQRVIEELGLEPVTAQIRMIPDTTMALAADDDVRMQKLLDLLEEHDDVNEVYTNYEYPESEEE